MDGNRALCLALARPESMAERTDGEWSTMLAAARETSLLGALWQRAREAGLETDLPKPVALHLQGAAWVAERRAEALRWELEELGRGMLTRMAPPVLLKGAAYLLADLPNAQGRLANDIDLLFPEAEIERAESLLFFDGWSGSHHNDYDQRYYREWMHELPPLAHRQRGTTLDLHHNILPRTFRVRPDAGRLREQSVALPAPWRFRMLAPAHMVLHAMVHLFSETDWERGLRDVNDIHVLVNHFAAREGDGFWEALLVEADALEVTWLAQRALWLCGRHLGTDIPPEVVRRLAASPRARRINPVARWMFHHGSQTRAASSTPLQDGTARGLLFLRGHWLKMPPGLLVRHLFYKAFLAEKEDDTDVQPEPDKHG
ncbi:nucleotidyltransferase family protein [Thioalkalivibrio sp. ALJ1]|uniref:nucleotidyltransferase domain-containing protein n=1 Tax=Thioalkalivibrio sp. ALJ1 TaxID=1158144 RepID=UPI00056E05C3|nr:nucleotidyltransferase family protein [Thioalkalivibrio sp. ALJ1]